MYKLKIEKYFCSYAVKQSVKVNNIFESHNKKVLAF